MSYKWNKEDVASLIKYFDEGLTDKEIAELLERTEKSICVKRNRLRLNKDKPVCDTEYTCLNCGTKFVDKIKNKRKFCGRECAGKYSGNKGRPFTQERREKLYDTLRKKGNIIKEDFREKVKKRKESRKKVVKNYRRPSQFNCKCGNCGYEFVSKKLLKICEKCRNLYYKYYRPSCKFNFNLSEVFYKIEGHELLAAHGMYKPSNRGDNLNGASRDHMLSVKYGFENNIDPSIISHPANCRIVLHSDNAKKNSKSSITLEELLKRIEEWDKN